MKSARLDRRIESRSLHRPAAPTFLCRALVGGRYPMNKTKATDLTLKQIAYEWARELEDERVPGRPSEQEIFANLVSAVRRGEFGSGPFEVQRTSRAKWRRSAGPDGQDICEINPPYLVSLDDLKKGVLPASGKGGIPWDKRDVEDDEPLSVRAFWKNLFLSKHKIGQWCDERAEKRPKFWFDDDSQVGPGRPPGSSQTRARRQKVYDLFDQIVQTQELSFKHGEMTDLARKIAPESDYPWQTVRDLISDDYKKKENSCRLVSEQPRKAESRNSTIDFRH